MMKMNQKSRIKRKWIITESRINRNTPIHEEEQPINEDQQVVPYSTPTTALNDQAESEQIENKVTNLTRTIVSIREFIPRWEIFVHTLLFSQL